MQELVRWASEDLWDAVHEGLDGYTGDLLMQSDEGDTVFILACCSSETRIVSTLLAHPQAPDVVNQPNKKGLTGFIFACTDGFDEVVALLLEYPLTDVNIADNDGNTGLMYASSKGQPKIVNMLLDHPRVDVNQVDKLGRTAFLRACKEGDIEIVDSFARNPNTNMNQSDNDGWTGFMLACSSGNKDMIELLLNHGRVDINAKNNLGMSGFLLVCRNGDFEMIRLLLEHPLLKVSQENNDGWTAADFISCKLHCATHDEDVINEVAENDKIVESIGRILRRGGSLKHQMMTVSCKGECKGTVMNLAQWAHDKRWVEIDAQLRQGYLGDINKTFRGKTLLEICCKSGKSDLVELILRNKNVDVDFLNNDRESALDIAVSRKRVQCVKLLLSAGATIDHDNKSVLEKLKEGPKVTETLVDEIRKRVLDEVRKRDQYPLHCLLEFRKYDKFRQVLKTHAISVDLTDHFGKTILMMAAEEGLVDIVRLILENGADIDFQQTERDIDGIQNKTALAFAAMAGHFAVVEVLLANLADMEIIYTRDANDQGLSGIIDEYSIDELIEDRMEEASPDTLGANLTKCRELLEKEKFYRASSTVYVEKLRSKLEAMADDAAFDEVLFRKAITTDPSLGRLFLNDCLHPDRHELGFSKIEAVYGTNQVHTSALYSILHLESDNVEYMYKAKKLLEHVVMQRVLDLKWEFFAQRMFIEQLLIYVVVIVSMTISVTMHELDDSDGFENEIKMWISTILFALLGLLIAQLLHPKTLWCCARFLHDGSLAFEPNFAVPNLSKNKSRAKWIMAAFVIFGTLALSVAVFFSPYLKFQSGQNNEGQSKDLYGLYKMVVNIVLWITTAYFLILEWKEFRGESGILCMTRQASSSIPVGKTSGDAPSTTWKYFESPVNCWQILTYILVLFVYVPYELNFIPMNADVVLCLGCTLTLMLWILSLQYFAVFRTGGYLIPMMSGILQDVWNFLALFSIFQLALTCSFYQLFHNKDNVTGYRTLLQSFTTTLFVLFGQYQDMWTKPDDDAWHKSIDDETPVDSTVRMFSMTLTLFQATMVTLLLLNVLLATMNRTVDRGLDNAKTESLWSYAQCILRMEVTLTTAQRDRLMYVDQNARPNFAQRHKTVWRRTTDSSVVEESAPLVVKPKRYDSSFRERAKVVGILNPAFEENIAKADLDICDEDMRVIQGLEETLKDWDLTLEQLKATTVGHHVGEIERIRTSIKHTNHFAKNPMFTEELSILTRSSRRILDIFTEAMKKRAPEAMDKPKRIQDIEKHVQHEMQDLKSQIAKLPVDEDAVMFYHIVHGVKLSDALARCDATIERRFSTVKGKFAREAMQEPTLGDLRTQLRDLHDSRTKAFMDKFTDQSVLMERLEVKVESAVQDHLLRVQQQMTVMKAEMDAQQAKIQSQMETIVRLLSQPTPANTTEL
ncbi:Aste57867_10574 [Aphanomyces stellatus]|uniref:Aste57867_10574 protein n=1 Tax=Aphanomyces stellatus TaxID=120398 RepID=A0A485KQQ1_9STRA|nr:hypothetical protein As57867_010534 [Aphanomyces stellatus]VFT87447.1 Aste57867_10574 [Aphanomyces stellatus]